MYPTYPKNYFKINMILQRFTATYVPFPDENRLVKLLNYTYNSFWIIYCHFIYIPMEILQLKASAANVSDLIEHVGMLITHFLISLKILTWFRKRKMILQLMDDLNDDEYKYHDFKDFRPGSVVHDHKMMFYKLFGIFGVVATMVPVSKILKGIFDYVELGDSIDGVNVTCQSVLPYYARFPFDTESKMRCGVALCIQMFPMVFMGWQIISYDMLFLNLCILLRAHLVNIQGAFRSIRPRCLEQLDLPETYEIMKDEDNGDLNDLMTREMRKTSVHLQKTIEICEQMENIFTFVSLAQTMGTLIVMVSCLYVMSIEKPFSPEFTADLDYLLGIYIQLSFYCLFGNEITIQSDAITMAIYEGDWTGACKPFKTSMLINMIRLQRPLVLTIGKFSPLTISTLLTVLRGSYSYFTVLKQTT